MRPFRALFRRPSEPDPIMDLHALEMPSDLVRRDLDVAVAEAERTTAREVEGHRRRVEATMSDLFNRMRKPDACNG